MVVATVRRAIDVDVPIGVVWDAVRDFGALHERLAAGFATATRVEGDDRVVTFVNGAVFRERLISSDDDGHRLAWTIVDGPWTHHNGSVELFTDSEGRTRLVWTTDMLPHDAVHDTEAMIDQACGLMKDTLEKNYAARESPLR
jgi:uncharacterized membrane protein